MPATYPDHSTPPAVPRYTISNDGLIRLELELSIEVFDSLRKLAEREGKSLSEVLKKAVILYRACSDAHHEGLAVGTTKNPESLETQFTGF